MKFILLTHFDPIVGVYTSANDSYPFDSKIYVESIQLETDSTFIYIERLGSFIKSKTDGKWSIIGDTLLLESNDPYKRKMEVAETYNANIENGYTKISFSNYDGSLSFYHLRVYKGKSFIDVKDIFNRSVQIKKRKVDKIVITTPSLEFPTYNVVYKKMNDFIFRLAPSRVFIHEKWLIRSEKIYPLLFNGNQAAYYLKRIRPSN